MIRKLVAIALAVLINCLVLAGFQVEGASAHSSAAPVQAAALRTLPTLTIRPTRAQIEVLRHTAKPVPASSATSSARAGARSPSRTG